jgi:hypothetical protein
VFSASSKYSSRLAAVSVRWSFITYKDSEAHSVTRDAVGFALYLATLPVSKPAFHKLLSLRNISGL